MGKGDVQIEKEWCGWRVMYIYPCTAWSNLEVEDVGCLRRRCPLFAFVSAVWERMWNELDWAVLCSTLGEQLQTVSQVSSGEPSRRAILCSLHREGVIIGPSSSSPSLASAVRVSLF